jgi:hypothetical protein
MTLGNRLSLRFPLKNIVQNTDGHMDEENVALFLMMAQTFQYMHSPVHVLALNNPYRWKSYAIPEMGKC